MSQLEWIGVDWGTSNLRAYAVDAFGHVFDELVSERGMGTLKPEEFEAALVDLVEPWLSTGETTPVYACGMVGARQGWLEARYRSVPCQPVSNEGLTRVNTADPRIRVQILPGLCQAEPADVMRGEETQVAGFLKTNPSFTGSICLPGTHSKWVTVDDGVVSSFQTFMTGELFSLIASHSVLRHSVASEGIDKVAFLKAALKAARSPESVVIDMFSVRASSLLTNPDPCAARARLSGMIIGQELGIARHYWSDGQPVALIGAPEISSLYAQCLSELGATTIMVDAKLATLSGLTIAANQEKAIAA